MERVIDRSSSRSATLLSIRTREPSRREGGEEKKKGKVPSASSLRGRAAFSISSHLLPVPVDRDRSMGHARFPFSTDKAGREKNLPPAEGGYRGIRNRFRYELSLFLHSQRTRHARAYAYVLEGAGRCYTRTPRAVDITDAGRHGGRRG